MRQIKKEATRRRLIEVAHNLFLKNGFDNTTIDRIVQKTKVSQRTFFRHFSTKEEIVSADMKTRLILFQEFLHEESDTVEPFTRVKKTLAESACEYDKIKDRLLNEYRIIMSSPVLTARDFNYNGSLEKHIAKALMTCNNETCLPRKHARVAGAAIYGGVRILKDEWFQNECSCSLAKQIASGDQITDMLARGFGPMTIQISDIHEQD